MTEALLIDSFEDTFLKQKLILPGDKVFIACSGGPDSVALFYLLKTLRAKWNLKLGLLHFNHRLRGRASASDEIFVRRLARENKVPVYIGRAAVKKVAEKSNFSLEEAARKARYDFFLKASKKYRIPKIALAHTRDDQAETVLMRMLQGTGLRGLSGIRPRLKIGRTVFVRPVLSFSKKDLLSFLKEERLSFRSDESNRSKRFLRNRIRLELIPWLAKDINPKVVDALARIPAIVEEENRLLAELEEAASQKVFGTFSRGRLALNRNVFLKFPPALQFRVMDRALKKLDPRSGISFDAWQNLRTFLIRKKFRYSLPCDIDLTLTPSQMLLYRKKMPCPPRRGMTLIKSG